MATAAGCYTGAPHYERQVNVNRSYLAQPNMHDGGYFMEEARKYAEEANRQVKHILWWSYALLAVACLSWRYL